MAKKGKGNNQNRQNNYFSQQVQKNGESFLNQKTPRDMAQDAERIFRDLVRGKVDLSQYGGYILNPSLLETLITKAGERYNYWWVVKISIENQINSFANIQVDANTQVIFTGVLNDAIAKFTVYQQLYNCLLIVQQNNSVQPLEQLPRVVGNYKFSI